MCNLKRYLQRTKTKFLKLRCLTANNNLPQQTIKYYRKHLLTLFAIALVLSGFLQCVYAIMQLLGIKASGHPEFAFTGGFYNPGPFGCYLAVIFPITLRLIYHNSKFQNHFGMGMVLLCAVLIPASMSRTAIIACGMGTLMAMSDKWNPSHLKWKKILIIALSCAVIGAGIYLIKKNSADGRMLMWKVAAQAVTEVPLTGVGWSNVAGTYGEAQERYFASGRGSEQEIMVADAPEYVFNEYLQIAIAYGCPATIIIIALIAGGVVIAIRNNAYGFAGSTAAVATAMFASYPLQFPLFVITIALILAGAWISSSSSAVSLTATTIIAVLTCLFFTHHESRDISTVFAVAHTLHRTHNYRKSNTMLLNLLPHTADPMVLNIISKNYRALGLPDSAEHYLQKSINRCPNRLYPHYLLMLLYKDSASFNSSAQQREARILLDMKEKIPSPAVEEMRKEAKTILAL